MGEINKPQLKPIGSIIGIGGKREVLAYLTSIFKAIGFEDDKEGLPAFAKFKGIVNAKVIRLTFSIFKRAHYKGIDADHFIRYRTFEGIRMNATLPLSVKTRLVVTKETKGTWIKKMTHLVLKFKRFKCIDINYLKNEMYSPDVIYGKQVIEDTEIETTIHKLINKQAKVLSWGIIQIPNQLHFGTTFADLTDFDPDKLQMRLNNIAKIADLLDTKTPSKQLELTKSEVLARDNPKALAWRVLGLYLFFIILGTGLLIGTLFLLAKLIGMT